MEEYELVDLWIDAIGDLGPYEPCPCGCGRKWRYVVRDGEKAIEECEQRFKDKVLASMGNSNPTTQL